jgi:hypothetical protein
MSAQTLLEELAALDIELRAGGDHLHYEGPEEAITPELLDNLRRHKAELMKVLVDKESYQSRVKLLGPSTRQLIETGWKPKERCGKTIYQSPQNGCWYSEEIALALLSDAKNNDPGEGVDS